MPNKGDEFHHFGWNACSSSLSPLTGHAFLERRYLIIPGMRSSRIYIVDTKPDPTKAAIHKIIEPEEIFRKTGYSRPHTVHCGPEGIYISTLGGAGKDGRGAAASIVSAAAGGDSPAPGAAGGSRPSARRRPAPPIPPRNGEAAGSAGAAMAGGVRVGRASGAVPAVATVRTGSSVGSVFLDGG
jgi:hypothetical protein